MTDEVHAYFVERYNNQSIRVVPGHWPDFKSKEEVDEWFELMTRLFDLALDDEDDV